MGKKKKKQNPSKQNPDNFQYIVYTDGGCIQNPGGRGGYGAVIIDTETGEITEKHGGFISTTNNRMEMMAVLIALETLPKNCTVLLHADSQYVLRTMSGEYSKKKNLDLWKKIDAARVGKKISLEWVPGHAGISENERCDELAAACGIISVCSTKPLPKSRTTLDTRGERLRCFEFDEMDGI